MVGYDKEDIKLQSWQYMFAGGASGAITRAICQPLDVIKIRFQLQVEPIAKGSKYTSVIQAFRVILKEESVVALWSGHVPAQYLSVTYGLTQFWCYEMLTEQVFKAQADIPTVYVPVINFTCGALSGSVATVLSFPFDTVRTRLIAEEKNNRIYKSVWHTIFHMSSHEGKLSLFKGLMPTIAQIAPHSGAQFMFYKYISEYFQKIDKHKHAEVPLYASLLSGCITGFLSKLTVYPFDLGKKRMQIQGFQKNRSSFGKQFFCKGFFDCILLTIKTEGFTSLYKGLTPSLAKAMLASALHFTLFEEICKAFKKLKT